MRASISRALLTLVLSAPAIGASAQEYCVTCTEPDAKYRCIIGGAKAAVPNERGQLLCITELAQSGGHVSCSVGAVTSAPCQGRLATVTLPDADLAAPPLAEMPPAPDPAVPDPAVPEGAPPASAEGAGEPQVPTPGPPKTVEELAKNTVQASGEGLKKAGQAVTDTAQSAGNAVGTAMKKTWTCLSSFFGDC